MHSVFGHPLFGVAITLLAYFIAVTIRQKTGLTLLHPLPVSAGLIITFLLAAGVSADSYMAGGQYISLFTIPGTAALAIAAYRQRDILRRNMAAVLLGCFAGALTSLVSVYALCKLAGFDDVLTASLMPKSVTTPIAMEVATALGGVPQIAAAAVLVTGVVGAVAGPPLLRFIGVKNQIAVGLGLGTSSHAMGTVKAIELGEVYGACSSAAIGVCGIITVILSLFAEIII